MSIVAQIVCTPGQDLTKTLESLKGKVDDVIVGEQDYHFDSWRNKNLKSQTLILNPGEELASDLDVGEGTYRVYVVDEKYVSKETRIVQPGDGKFVNPVYECFDTKDRPPLVNVFIRPVAVRYPDLVDRWKKEEPGSCEANYYKAFEYLGDGRKEEFVKEGEYFLFRTGNKHQSSITMMQYYLGCMYLGKNPNKSASYFLSGLETQPLMAEFWCGLGDCFRRTKQLESAKRMYKNAVAMGMKRDPADDLPVLLDMYDAYPKSFIGEGEGAVVNLG